MNPIFMFVVGLIFGAIGGALVMFLIARSAEDRTAHQDHSILENEKRALEERYADQLRERDDAISHAKAESNQLAAELMAARQEAEARVAALNDDLLIAIEQRSKLPTGEDKSEELQHEIEHRDSELHKLSVEINKLSMELAEAKASLATIDRGHEAEIAAKEAALTDAKVSLAAIERTHQVELAAKQSECERILVEKDEALNRERTLLSTHVQNQLDEQRRLFAETENAMLAKLGQASDESLKTATAKFLEVANETFAKAGEQAKSEEPMKQEAVEGLLTPVREALERLERQNQLMDRRRDSAFDAIEKGIQQLTSEATQLANALRKPATQGAWGETAIVTILENAGLIAGENFILQESGEDNKKRTDVVIKLPQDRLLVIDSKVPLDAFWDGTNAPTDEARAIRMRAHARMVREHVKELGSAYYWASYDTLPSCVIMFLPTEGAYFAALEADPKLLQEAKDSGVYLANPMTVLNMAHIAAYVLADERVRQNAQEIKNLGSELYERLRMFGEHFTNVGQNLRQSVDSYNKALTWVDHNVMPTARKMQLLGTQKGKALKAPTHVDKSVKSFQTADMRELTVESTYEDAAEPEA